MTRDEMVKKALIEIGIYECRSCPHHHEVAADFALGQLEAAPSPWVEIHCDDDLPVDEGFYVWQPRKDADVKAFGAMYPRVEHFKPYGQRAILEGQTNARLIKQYAAWMPIFEYVEPSPERSTQEALNDSTGERIDG
jgi:hypothetical protein